MFIKNKFSDNLINYAKSTFEDIHQNVLVRKSKDEDW